MDIALLSSWLDVIVVIVLASAIFWKQVNIQSKILERQTLIMERIVEKFDLLDKAQARRCDGLATAISKLVDFVAEEERRNANQHAVLEKELVRLISQLKLNS